MVNTPRENPRLEKNPLQRSTTARLRIQALQKKRRLSDEYPVVEKTDSYKRIELLRAQTDRSAKVIQDDGDN